MGFGKLASFFILTVFFKPMICQTPNTDGSFVFEFLRNMGLNVSDFPVPVCSWKGVSCDDKHVNVIKLDASGLGLSGVIPENTIGKLVKLEYLDLSNNQITSLPSDFWSLGSLKNLNISFNKVSGTFSGNVGNFGELDNLDLSFNNFTGSIPDALSALSKLTVLNLSGNGFESTIPSGILHCNDLVSIDLSENKLSGSLPNGFFGAYKQLKFLNLAGNRITGRESSFSGMKLLSYLNISSNLFKGSVVGIFEGPLQVIDLSRNQFQGHIAQVNISSSFNWSNLMHLDLSDNQFSGEFLTQMTHAQNLKHLNLAHNRFTKQKFLQVSMLAKLEYLNFSGTNLIGEIPGNISLLNNLQVLDLSKNHLSNHIPSVISNNIQILDISQNNLSGTIPLLILQELHRMKSYNFSYNNLSFCASLMSPDILQSSFIGSVNSCPIAVNPVPIGRKSESHHWGLKFALALTLSMFCLLAGLLFLAFRCRRKTGIWVMKHDSVNEEQAVSGPFSFQTDSTTWVADVRQPMSVRVIIFEKPLLNYTFADLLCSTSHFDRGTLLAEGRFGPVYGGLLPGGIHVAVKVLVNGSTMTDEEAVTELEYLGRIRHPNLVSLTGYCLAGDQRIVIYEYMENGNLQNLLYDLPLGIQTTEDWSSDTWEDENTNGIQNVGSEGSLANWSFRKKIALGTARALAFLHHGCSPPIIHRDVKASSVYLDSNLEPRLSDFGLAKIFGNGLEEEITCGSPGYVPPEFLQSESGGSSPKAAPTPKSDVYGFGVILFELISGKRPVEDDYPEEKDANLVSWVRGLVRRNQGIRAIDPKIRGTGPDPQIVEALKIGYLCTAEIPSKRPSMQQVVGLLKDLEPNAAYSQ